MTACERLWVLLQSSITFTASQRCRALQREEVTAAIEAVSKVESKHDPGSVCGHLDLHALEERDPLDGKPTIALETARAASLRAGQLLVRPRAGVASTGTRDDLMFVPYQLDDGGAVLCVLEISGVYRATVPPSHSVQLALVAEPGAEVPGDAPAAQPPSGSDHVDGGYNSSSSSDSGSSEAESGGQVTGAQDARAESIVRFAVGMLHELEVVVGKGLNTHYCEGPVGGDGAGPARSWPTLMRRRTKRNAQDVVSYPWAVLLCKGEGPMVSAERGRVVISFAKSAAHA